MMPDYLKMLLLAGRESKKAIMTRMTKKMMKMMMMTMMIMLD